MLSISTNHVGHYQANKRKKLLFTGSTKLHYRRYFTIVNFIVVN